MSFCYFNVFLCFYCFFVVVSDVFHCCFDVNFDYDFFVLLMSLWLERSVLWRLNRSGVLCSCH